MKMYIVIKNTVPLGLAMAAAAHASLACYLKYKDTPETQEWVGGIFRKSVCITTEAEFEKLKEIPNNVVMTESALQGAETAIAFAPREEWPNRIKFLPLYK